MGRGSGPPPTPGISKILAVLGLEMYKEASQTMPYPTSRSPGKRELVLTGEIRTSVVSGKTPLHSHITQDRGHSLLQGFDHLLGKVRTQVGEGGDV